MILNINDYTSKKWNVAGGLRWFEQILAFINYFQNSYDVDGQIITSVYDSHPGLKWNGGRYILPFQFSIEESIRRIKAFNNLSIGFNITFSNVLINEKDLYDKDCNQFLKDCENSLNSVIVSSHLLKDYIRSYYPSYKIIASIGFNRKDIDFYKETLKQYDIVVLHPDLNSEYDFIKQLDLSRLEILVNELCIKNCQFRQQHIQMISEINYKNPAYFYYDNNYMNGSCIAARKEYKFSSELILSLEDVQYLNNLGIKHFKIQGREHNFDEILKKMLNKYVLQGTIKELLQKL